MENAVLRRFHNFAEACGDSLFDGDTMNDRFFELQREEFENDEPCWLGVVGGTSTSSEVAAFHTLRGAWMDSIFAYIAASASELVAEQMFDDPDSLRLHVWASVHEGVSSHVPHDHENSAVSGVRAQGAGA